MKKLFIACFVIFLTLKSFSQIDLKFFEYKDTHFILPNIDNLIVLYNSSENDFKEKLTECGFDENENQLGLISYILHGKGLYFQSVSKDTARNIVSIEWTDFENKSKISDSLEVDLKNNFLQENNKNMRFYRVEKHGTYKIGIKSEENTISEYILIKKED